MVNDSCLRGHHSFFWRMEGDTPFVTANHCSLEHKQGKQCQVQTERTKYPGGRKIAPKETWLTYENNYSYTDKQQSPDAEITPVIVTGSCHLRIEPGGNITVHTQLSCFCSLCHKKTRFSSYQILAHLTKHIACKKKTKKLKAIQECAFVK